MTPVPKISSASRVAEYFISRSNQEKKPITNKKLQKLVYYAQVWSLVLNKEKLFNEKIEAWIHGPAIPSLYKKFKNFEFNPIVFETENVKFNFNKRQSDLLNSVWKVYGKYNAEYLEALTHSELPWQEARKDLPITQASNNVIDLQVAKKYYAGVLERSKR